MKIDVYSDFNSEINNIWIEFEEQAIMTPFQSWNWLDHWQKTIGGPLLGTVPQLVHIESGDDTLAILPLGIRKVYGAMVLEWLGGPNTDYMGPLVHPDLSNDHNYYDLCQKILTRLLDYDVIHLQKQSDRTVEFLNKIGFSSGCKQKLESYKIKLSEDWDAYFNGLNSKLRSDSRRQYRRLLERWDIEFIMGNNSEDKAAIIKSMITQKRRRYRETGARDSLSIAENRQFYEGLAFLSSSKLKIHCSSLNVGNVKIATHVGFVSESTFYYIMPAHEGGEWGNFSPGRLLLIELIKWSYKNELEFFDFTVGAEAYKKDWCNIESRLSEYKKSESLTGLFFIILLEIKSYLKQSQLLLQALKRIRKL